MSNSPYTIGDLEASVRRVESGARQSDFVDVSDLLGEALTYENAQRPPNLGKIKEINDLIVRLHGYAAGGNSGTVKGKKGKKGKGNAKIYIA